MIKKSTISICFRIRQAVLSVVGHSGNYRAYAGRGHPGDCPHRQDQHPVAFSARPSVGAAQILPRCGILSIVIPDPGPAAQAVADIETGEGADREASACSVGHEAGLPALVARRVGAARHEAAREQGP